MGGRAAYVVQAQGHALGHGSPLRRAARVRRGRDGDVLGTSPGDRSRGAGHGGLGVPLYSGFRYAAVGSCVAPAAP